MFNTIGNIAKNYFVAIYIRLSKEDIKENGKEDESESIQNQKTLLTKYVTETGYTLVDIYVDDGFTGTNFDRPAFQRMLRDIEAGKINMVVTKDLSRLSRDYIGTGEYVEKWFPAHNVRYIALTDAIDTAIDSTNNDIAPFKAILNDMYAKDLSKKIRTALHTMQSEGKWVGGCPPFGYKVDPDDKNHLVIDDIEGPIIKKIFNLFINGHKINEIRNILNDEKAPTFSITRNRSFEREGKSGNIYGYWSNTTLKKILKNRLYTGDMIQNRRSRINYKYRKIVCNPEDKWIIVENTHEALIDKKTFLKVQELLPKQNKRNDRKGDFLLDKLLQCADCSHNISIRARRANGKSTTVCNYYRKYKVEYNLCTSHGFDYDTLENGVINIIKNIMDSLQVDKIEKAIQKECNECTTIESVKNNISKLEIDINKLKTSLDNMYMDKLLNKVTEEMYERVHLKLAKDIEEKEIKLKEAKEYLNEIENSGETAENLKALVNEFINVEHPTRDLILKLINHISIHENGNIDIHFNFKELNIIYDSYVA